VQLLDAIQKLRADVGDLDGRRAELTSELEGLEAEQAELLSQVQVLEAVAERYGISVGGGTDEAPRSVVWIPLNRQEAALRALNEIGEPAHLREIVEFLFSKGRRDDTLNLISAALSTLRRKGRVVPVGAGVWRLTTTAMVPMSSTVHDLGETG
jgi:hypothetical protein